MDRSYLEQTVFRPPVTQSVFLEDLVIPPVSSGCGLRTHPV